ncbi:MAG: hypothetical protein F6K50_33880 [Moorea sp. SIO3I7]|uniref:VMAP-C domain-containing protein n=1 Tax=Moorena sp. SIO3I8 TaxID=2607833 RepID=UPI0013C173BA|nr:effector-associated domain EAD1-containing protein [Moorena sp. SIO3I8]NEO00270.1 hypothetical protein [Moorena sp. SIO3I7]NEO05674.1 hypothetical protein [Moorena sp. SIO3I8]
MNAGNPPGYLLKKINKALCSAFPSKPDLKMMVLYQFSIHLEEVAGGKNLKEIVQELVDDFNNQNKLIKLINKALKENPDNPDLKAIKEKFKITTSLVKLLLPLEKNFINQMQQAYRACCPDELLDDWEDELPESLAEILGNLDDIPQQNDDEKLIVQFVARLLKTGDIPKSHGDKLKQWIKENANNPSDLLSQSSSNSQNHQQQNLHAQPYLLVKVDPSKQYHQQRQPSYFVSAWFIPDISNYDYFRNHQDCKFLETPLADGESEQDVFSLEDLQKLIKFFLNQSNQYYKKSSCKPSIVFVLPYQLLNYEFERIEIKNNFDLTLPIGSQYCVVIRSLKRLDNLKEIPYRTNCITKWETIKSSCQNRCAQKFVDVTNFNDWNKLYAYLETTNAALKLNKSPCNNIFRVIDTTAIPVALWLRKNNFTTINCQYELEQLLNSQINQLPEKVKQQRLDAFGKGNKQEHIGHHLSLLWEDPYLLPPQIDYTTL